MVLEDGTTINYREAGRAGGAKMEVKIAESSGAITIGADSFLNFNEVTGEPFFRWWRSGHYHVFRDIPDRLLNDCRDSQCVN